LQLRIGDLLQSAIEFAHPGEIPTRNQVRSENGEITGGCIWQ
jgi:hypothetical protein